MKLAEANADGFNNVAGIGPLSWTAIGTQKIPVSNSITLVNAI